MHQTALIVDDSPEMQRALGAALASAGIASLVAENTATMWRLLDSRPDCIIFGLDLPDAEFVDLLRQLALQSGIPVLIHSPRSADLMQRIGEPGGTVDCLPWPCTADELHARVRDLLQRNPPAGVPPDSGIRHLRFGHWTLDTAARELFGPDGKPAPLGGSACALLAAFVEHPFEPLSREQLSRVLKRQYAPYDRIIDVHVSQIRRVLGKQDNGSPFIRTLRSEGYVFVAPVETD